MTRGGMLDVVLTDDDGEPGADDRSGRGHVPGAPARPPRTRRPDLRAGEPPSAVPSRARRRGLLAVAAVATTAVAAGGLLADDGAADRATILAAHPRVLDVRDGPLRRLWEAPGGAVHTVTVGDGLVVGTFLSGSAHALVGTDVATGRDLWASPLPEVSNTRDLACVTVVADGATTGGALLDGAPPGGVSTGGVSMGDVTAGAAAAPAATDGEPPAGATHVVCRVVTARASLADGAQGFEAALLVVLDARTGDRVGERPLTSRYSTLAVAGGDLLVAETLRDGHGSVVRQDPLTGSVRWTFRTTAPLPDVSDGPPVLTAQVQRGVVVADGPGAWALTEAGEPVGEWLPRGVRVAAGVCGAPSLTVLPDGRLAATDATIELGAGAPAGAPVGAVTAGGERDGFPLPGRVLTPVVDDGSAPDVLLTVPVGAGRVVALDAGSGRELWRGDVRPGGQTPLLDGRLVLIADGRVRALDVRTGEPRWAAVADVVASGPQLLTDGEHVLVPVLTRADGPVLVALGLHDGGERWRVAAPAGVERFEVAQGRLLALLDRSTVAFG